MTNNNDFVEWKGFLNKSSHFDTYNDMMTCSCYIMVRHNHHMHACMYVRTYVHVRLCEVRSFLFYD